LLSAGHGHLRTDSTVSQVIYVYDSCQIFPCLDWRSISQTGSEGIYYVNVGGSKSCVSAYKIDYADGTYSIGKFDSVKHQFKMPGNYLVTLEVFAEDRRTYSDKMLINVASKDSYVLPELAGQIVVEKNDEKLPKLYWISIGLVALLLSAIGGLSIFFFSLHKRRKEFRPFLAALNLVLYCIGKMGRRNFVERSYSL